MPTIRRCCIVGCQSNSRQNTTLQFFQFPKPENPFHKLWKQACQASLSRILPFKKPVVCAIHFHPTNIGGRRLTTSAVPSLHLEVPSNLRAIEHQAMIDEIERSRKCAYINAVVYEWLVRANLNPQLRGSITHGMIKEKADTAKQLVGSNSFEADNRWLNRFRETHLAGFAQKLSTNQLKPMGPSLWIPDIVQDLQQLYPPTNADRIANLESMPEQYIDYMHQYGGYDDDEEQDTDDGSSQQPTSGFDTFAQQQGYNYDKFYYERQQQEEQLRQHHQMQQQQLLRNNRAQSDSPSNRLSPYANKTKRLKTPDNSSGGKSGFEQFQGLIELPDDEEIHSEAFSLARTSRSISSNDSASTKSNKSNRSSSKLHGETGKGPAKSSYLDDRLTPNELADSEKTEGKDLSPVAVRLELGIKEITTYAEALEHLKPLEEFVLDKENFRAIGLISQLEEVLRKAES